ncbi:MAG: KEOPS complex subunit Cgi121 [Candidatus Thorarchaeota archaeon]|jgi:tRNA threonylcarbamoyladenosine modification (KEOPS) complex Cgi121 subunit
MYLDTLVTDKGILSVGIVDIVNEKTLNTKQLLDLVSTVDSKVIAIQLFDASKIVDTQHLLSASQNALNAWNGEYAQSRSLSVEIAVFASGQHQIGRALATVGVSDNLPSIAAVVIASETDDVTHCINTLMKAIGTQSEPEFPPNPKRMREIMDIFGIKKSEMDVFMESDNSDEFQRALSKCVVSRVSSVAFDI